MKSDQLPLADGAVIPRYARHWTLAGAFLLGAGAECPAGASANSRRDRQWTVPSRLPRPRRPRPPDRKIVGDTRSLVYPAISVS